jgi:hypothetical protein
LEYRYSGIRSGRADQPEAAARKYFGEFGRGAYCGFGRLPASELANVPAGRSAAMEIATRH